MNKFFSKIKFVVIVAIVVVSIVIAILFQGTFTNTKIQKNENTKIQEKKLDEIIGSSHVIGRYHFTNEDFLNEGADALLEMGTKVIKVWYYYGVEGPSVFYPYNSDWPEVNSLIEGAEKPYYKELFEKPFTTFMLNASSFVVPDDTYYWHDGISDAQAKQEEKEFYEFSKYLLETYNGSGKTFVLQHHEGDWHCRDGVTDINIVPSQQVFDNMVKWLNARQAGVSKARRDCDVKDVYVYHAAEICVVWQSMVEKKPNMVDMVLPRTKLDLVSYSCYDTSLKAAEGNPELFRETLKYIKANMPDSEVFGNDNVYIGEFGIPENEYTTQQIEDVMTNTVEVALDENCPYIVYWQLYCNEFKNAEAVTPAKSNKDMRGFWLIRPDGSKSWYYDYFKKMFK